MSEVQKKAHVFSIETNRRRKEREEHLKGMNSKIPDRYEGDIWTYLKFCHRTNQDVSADSFLDYLYTSVVEERIKRNTWDRRVAAVKKYLIVEHNMDFDSELSEQVKLMRDTYNLEDYAILKDVRGKSHMDKDELLESIYALPTREKAITLVNLITANRPSEMVRIRIRDFELSAREVRVYMLKQKEWHIKRITKEVADAVREYIQEYNLKADDYFIGRTYRGGRYESRQISERAYNQLLDRTLDLSAYNFRKTQVFAMHEAGADLKTIAEQTGHKSLDTLSNHYLNVSSKTIDKFL